jgi:hypothetical protein
VNNQHIIKIILAKNQKENKIETKREGSLIIEKEGILKIIDMLMRKNLTTLNKEEKNIVKKERLMLKKKTQIRGIKINRSIISKKMRKEDLNKISKNTLKNMRIISREQNFQS